MTTTSNERAPLLPPSPSSLEFEHGVTEQQLLSRSSNSSAPSRVTRTPLPVKQLVVVCVMRLTEPISYTLIFPFINQMLQDMKVSEDPKKIGYYAGIIESLFAISQLFTAIFWGRLSDRVGRKPVMLTGLLGMAISVTSFGLQKTYIGLIISRLVAGMMNGNNAILQSIVGEITDSTNFADAVSYLPLCFAVGSIIGPIFGGYLSLPAQQYPNLFGDCEFLIEYPYFLPCFAGGLLNFLAIILGIFFMEETLETKKKRPIITPVDDDCQDYGTLISDPEGISPAGPMTALQTDAKPPSIRSLCTQPMLLVFLAFTLMHFQNIAFQVAIPLYGYTRIEDGGLGLGLDDLGFVISISGFGSIASQLWIFPQFQRKFGPLRLFQFGLGIFTVTNMCIPLISYLARLPGNKNSYSVAYMTFILLLRSPGVMCYVCTMMMTKILAPNNQALGTINGMHQTCRSLGQAIAPMVGSSLFALSISLNVLDGNLLWVVMIMICLVNHACSFLIDPKSFAKVNKSRTN